MPSKQGLTTAKSTSNFLVGWGSNIIFQNRPMQQNSIWQIFKDIQISMSVFKAYNIILIFVWLIFTCRIEQNFTEQRLFAELSSCTGEASSTETWNWKMCCWTKMVISRYQISGCARRIFSGAKQPIRFVGLQSIQHQKCWKIEIMVKILWMVRLVSF